jgi:spermidine synthase
MAAWLDAGDEAVFYEIDPAVIDLATDATVFSFIHDSQGTVRIVEGDGRLSLADIAATRHDLIVIDAFSSDAIPVHLLTREALAEYRRALTPDGVIAFHISNRFFDLQPVLARLAADASLHALSRVGIGDVPGSSLTTVVALGSPAALADLAAADGWAAPEAAGAVWTDDHADVLSALSGL